MAAVNTSPGTNRRLQAAPDAASSVDAAFVDLEPGVSVTSHPRMGPTMLTLLEATAAAIRQLPRGARLPRGGVLASLTRAEHAAAAR